MAELFGLAIWGDGIRLYEPGALLATARCLRGALSGIGRRRFEAHRARARRLFALAIGSYYGSWFALADGLWHARDFKGPFLFHSQPHTGAT
jgi:hypothetical protein